MIKIFTILILFIICSCSDKGDNNIKFDFKSNNINTVRILKVHTDQEMIVNDIDKMEKLIDILIEESKVEFVKFYPEYKISFMYEDKLYILLVKGSLIKYKGVCYKVNEKFSNSLTEIIDGL